MRVNALVGAAWVGVAALGGPAQGAYLISLSSGGMSSAIVGPGESCTVEVLLASDAMNTHNSAIYRVEFSSGGLEYMDYAWSAPYLNSTIDDDSKPLRSQLPAILNVDTLSGVGYPAGVVDVELSNVLPAGGAFGSGLLTTLTIKVPSSYSGPDAVLLSLVPDQVALNGIEIPTQAGTAFTIVIPGCGTACSLLCGLMLTRRQRQ